MLPSTLCVCVSGTDLSALHPWSPTQDPAQSRLAARPALHLTSLPSTVHLATPHRMRWFCHIFLPCPCLKHPSPLCLSGSFLLRMVPPCTPLDLLKTRNVDDCFPLGKKPCFRLYACGVQMTDQGTLKDNEPAVVPGVPLQGEPQFAVHFAEMGPLIQCPHHPQSSVTHKHTHTQQHKVHRQLLQPRKSRSDGWMFLQSYSDFLKKKKN